MHGDSSPKISVIIPSRDGDRGGAVARLLESIARQDYPNFDHHLVVGVFPQGRAINEGVEKTTGEFLVIADDDSWFADEHVLSQLMSTIQSNLEIGMAGASIVPAPDASHFQQRAAQQFPRFSTPVVSEITDSDLACHGCCIFRRSVFEYIGGEREDLVRGLDPDLRARLRAKGYRVVLAPHCRIHHPMPEGWHQLVRIFFRNGKGSAYAYKFEPDSVIDTAESLHTPDTPKRSSLPGRVVRFVVRLIQSLVRGRMIRLVAYGAYAMGYLWGLVFAKRMPETGAVRAVSS